MIGYLNVTHVSVLTERFETYTSWISYTDFRNQMQSKMDVVYMTPREAKNHHGHSLSSWR